MTSIQDIDPIVFLKDYLGIELLPYQKMILQRMMAGEKVIICPSSFNPIIIGAIIDPIKTR